MSKMMKEAMQDVLERFGPPSIAWKHSGPLEATVDDVQIRMNVDSWSVSKRGCTLYGRKGVGTDADDAAMQQNAVKAAALLNMLFSLGFTDVAKPEPEREGEIDMDHDGICLLCERGYVGSGERCFHPAAQVRDAFRLLLRVPRVEGR